jgi:glutaminyl-peptide cyclotransferase
MKHEDIHFDGAQAYVFLKKLCKIGPRPSGSPGMAIQGELLVDHFIKLGGRVELQSFQVPHPEYVRNMSLVKIVNIIVRWRPEIKDRILLCAHYDTLPLPLRDPINPMGTFIGANDNAGGVALLMELAHNVPNLTTKYGIDFVFFDGEEFIYRPNGRFFLGSEYFSRNYILAKPDYRYRCGVLLDMIAGKNLKIHQEGYSDSWHDTKPLVDNIWAVARKLGVSEFIPDIKHYVADDHIMLHDIGKIPCIDIIDFDYLAWHTEADTPEQCSASSLAKVGWVIQEWLRELDTSTCIDTCSLSSPIW